MRDIFVRRALAILENGGERFDANETAFLERELTAMRAKALDVLYPDNLGRRFVPQATDIPATANTYAYKIYDHTGVAKVTANDTDDAPRVDVSAREVTGGVYNVIDSYGWGLNEIAEAVRVGIPLTEKKAVAARNVIENGVDLMIYQGRTDEPGETNLVTTGLVNNAAVASPTALTHWTMLTDPDTVYNEMSDMVTSVIVASKQRFRPNAILMGTDRHRIISTLRMGVDTTTTVLQAFMTNNPGITVDAWWRLDLAGGNAGGRMIVYQKDPMILESVVPMEFTQIPPQAKGFNFIVNCKARCGGVKVYYPSAIRYGDFPAP